MFGPHKYMKQPKITQRDTNHKFISNCSFQDLQHILDKKIKKRCLVPQKPCLCVLFLWFILQTLTIFIWVITTCKTWSFFSLLQLSQEPYFFRLSFSVAKKVSFLLRARKRINFYTLYISRLNHFQNIDCGVLHKKTRGLKFWFTPVWNSHTLPSLSFEYIKMGKRSYKKLNYLLTCFGKNSNKFIKSRIANRSSNWVISNIVQIGTSVRHPSSLINVKQYFLPGSH